MSVFWLQPAVWWAAGVVAVPILIHLLARQQSVQLPFPSLRFLQATRVAAFRRRSISDWPLLLTRCAVLMMAVAALAAPVFVSSARQREWDARVARALVVAPAPMVADPGALATQTSRLLDEERSGAFASAVFAPETTVGDGVREALTWLARQAPASRELVIVGDLRDEAISARDLETVAPSIGIRFLPIVSTPIVRSTRLSGVWAAAETIESIELAVRFEDDSTDVVRQPVGAVQRAIEVRASAADQSPANALVEAVTAEGVLWPRQGDRRVVVVFAGGARPEAATPPAQQWIRSALERLSDLRGGEADGALFVDAGIASTHQHAVHLLARVVAAAFVDPLDAFEPRRIAPASLAGWSRPRGGSPPNVAPQDESDRRYFWAAALVLLGIEQLLRRSRARPRSDSPAAALGAETTESRVA